VAYALASSGGQVHLFARRMEQAERIVQALTPHTKNGRLAACHWSALAEVSRHLPKISLIVNTTPLGMSPHIQGSPWPEKLSFPQGAFCYDLVYNPSETTFVKAAKAGGCRAVTGLGMLLHQGAQAFQLWTGQEPDLDIMAAAIFHL
jgi:shikimate dehydrogenase